MPVRYLVPLKYSKGDVLEIIENMVLGFGREVEIQGDVEIMGILMF